MHRGVFAMNEQPELVQVGLFNILEERDVLIRGYSIKFDINVLIQFFANAETYNRSGKKVIPQLKDRIGGVIHMHYLDQRDLGITRASRSSNRNPTSNSTTNFRCPSRRS